MSELVIVILATIAIVNIAILSILVGRTGQLIYEVSFVVHELRKLSNQINKSGGEG